MKRLNNLIEMICTILNGNIITHKQFVERSSWTRGYTCTFKRVLWIFSEKPLDTSVSLEKWVSRRKNHLSVICFPITHMIYFSTLKTCDEISTADWNFPISRNLKQLCLEYFTLSLTLFMRFAIMCSYICLNLL